MRRTVTGGIVTSRCPDNDSQAYNLIMWYVLCSTVDCSISDKFLAGLLILLLSLYSHGTAKEMSEGKVPLKLPHITSASSFWQYMGHSIVIGIKPALLHSVTGEPSILASSHVLKLLPGFRLPKYQSINSLLSSLLSSSLAHHLNLLQQLRAKKLQKQSGTGLTRRNDKPSVTAGQNRGEMGFSIPADCWHTQEMPLRRGVPVCWGRWGRGTRNKWTGVERYFWMHGWVERLKGWHDWQQGIMSLNCLYCKKYLSGF